MLSSMTLLLLLGVSRTFSLSIVDEVITNPKLFLFYGKPTTVTSSYTVIEDSWETCMSLCYYDADCQLLYRDDTTCQFFKYGNLTIQELGVSEHRVAFKITSTSTTCPLKTASLSTSSQTEWTDGTLIYRSSLSYNSSEWQMVYTVSKCPNNTQLYTRVSGGQTFHVCVGFRVFWGSGYGNYYDAQKLCRGDGGYALTGPWSAAEYDEFKALGRQITATLFANQQIYYFIDGISTGLGQYAYDDDSHEGSANYPFMQGEPNARGADAPMIMLLGNEWIADYEGGLSPAYFRGALCRVQDV